MGAYHQMGHHAANLARDPRLQSIYAGLIMSPLNSDPTGLGILCAALKSPDTIFDPQCYALGSQKGQLYTWSYVQSAAAKLAKGPYTLGDWQQLAADIADACIPLGHRGGCSPAAVRKSFTDADLGFDVQIGNALATHLAGKRSVNGLQTAAFPVQTLVGTGRVQTIASILTTGRLKRLYLVPDWTKTDGELGNADELCGFIDLVRVLTPHRQFIVGYCGPEMILWTAAGADAVASGKYGNQQRFDLGGFGGAPSGGAGTVAYYFEESLLTWLRTEDIVRLDRLGYKLGLAHDPFFPAIRKMIAALQATPVTYVQKTNRSGKPLFYKNGRPQKKRIGPPDWTSLGWSQWLWWFADAERRLDTGQVTARTLVDNARKNWAWLKV